MTRSDGLVGRPDLTFFLPRPGGGGVPRVMLTLASTLAREGRRIEVIFVEAKGVRLESLSKDVGVVDLKASRALNCIPALVSYFRSRRPPVVLAAPAQANVAALVARKLARIPMRLVVSERNNLSEGTARVHRLRERVLPLVMKWTYPLADSIVAVSRGVADDLASAIQIDREKITVIYNPVVRPELVAQAQEPLDHRWLSNSEVPVVLAAGRLEPQKQFTTLLRAFARVRKELRARLLILGEGDERGSLESLARELGIEDDLEMPGWVPNPYKYMKRASLFVLSSRFEGLPNALIEAMAVGTQVVSTDCPSGPDEILEGGKWGTLVPVGDDRRMAEAICEILSGRRHYECVESRAQHFDLQTAVNAYSRVLFPASGPAPQPE